VHAHPFIKPYYTMPDTAVARIMGSSRAGMIQTGYQQYSP
jgi:hypothetical protein